MTEADSTPYERWAGKLESFSKQLRAHVKAVSAAGDDPFARRELVERTAKTLSEVGVGLLQGLDGVRDSLEKECLESRAEFWQRFCAAAGEVGWEVCGSTERRMVSRAFIVELKGEWVSVDGLPGRHSPHVPTLFRTMKPHIDSLSVDYGSHQQFANLLARAYDSLGGGGDVSIESVFRQAVFLMQPTAFWANIDQAKFQTLPRPAFRYLLSAVLSENTRATDGRELRLTPTVTRKDVWELYSPVEGRVVQVGRLAFISK